MSALANVVVTKKSSSPLEPKPESPRLVFCLSIDMFRYTETGLQFTSSQLNGFNKNFVEQLSPYLEKFDLPKDLPKFTGDGWLLMTDEPQQGLALCCLSIVLSKVFQKEMHESTGISLEKIPALRLAICTGWDIPVSLPNGQSDWPGDSARKAVRVSGWCQPNMIQVDYTVLDMIFRDFHCQALNEQEWPPEYRPKRDEQARCRVRTAHHVFPAYLHCLSALAPH